MRHIIIAATLAATSLSATAAGTLDGIYLCHATIGQTTIDTFLTINGHPDGRHIYAVPAMQPSQYFYGYGIGHVAGNKYTGTTAFNLPFDMTLDGNGGFSGTVGVVIDGIGNMTVPVSCALFF